MRVAVVLAVLTLVAVVLITPAYGTEQEKPKGKTPVPDGMADVIIYGTPTAPKLSAGIQATKSVPLAASIQSTVPSAKIMEKYALINGAHAYVPTDAVDKLKALGYTVEENKKLYIQLDSSGPVVLADKARRAYMNGNGTKVCVLDTGIDLWNTRLQMPPSSRRADFVNRVDGTHDPNTNGTLEYYTIHVNQTMATLNFSINWGWPENRFDMYVWYQNGTYMGGTNGTSVYQMGYYWLKLNLTDAPAGLYNITTNNTMIGNTTSGEYLSVFWDPFYPAAGITHSDYNGHGTHVAGIITANDSRLQGVAQGVTLYTGTVCVGRGGTCSSGDIISGFEWCTANGADIISMSVGGGSSSNCDESMDVAADSAAAISLPVIAGGNSDVCGVGGPVTTPGCARKVLAVGSVSDAGAVSGFSCVGPSAGGNIKPDVAAPGESVNSTYIINGFTSLDGTSMATPHAAGIAAIAKQANPTWTTHVLKAALMAAANKTRGGNHLDNNYGSGLVDVMQLVTRPYVNVTQIHRGEGFAAYGRWATAEARYATQTMGNSNYTTNVTVPNGAVSIKSVLYWMENSNDTRSNMTLYLYDPAGRLADNSSIANSVTQMVYNYSPPAGNWTLNVSGVNVQGTKTVIVFTSIKLNTTSRAYAQVNATGTPANFSATADYDRANYTNVTGNDWFVGVHQIKFYSNDTRGVWGVSGTANITMIGWAKLNRSAHPVSVNEDTSLTMACRVMDSNTSQTIQGYNVSFWDNTSFISSNVTDGGGWANITTTFANPGAYNITCNITNNATLYYDAAQPNNYTAITVNDNTAPQYSGLSGTTAIYNTPWQSNVTWTDNVGLRNVTFESDFVSSEVFVNYTVSNYSTSQFYFVIGAGNMTVGRDVGCRWWANDTSGRWNYTVWQNFSVDRAPAGVRLFFNGTEADRRYTRGSIVNVTAMNNISGKYVAIGTNLTTEIISANSTGTAANITNTTTLNITSYNVTAHFAGDFNHSEAYATHFLVIRKENGQSCSSGDECYGGACCSGACADDCGGGGGGGGGGAAAPAASAGKQVDLTEKLAQSASYQSVFSQGDTAIYASAGQNHTIKVAAVTNSTAVLTAGSANITLAQGESRNLDLDKDGTADLSVTLNGISNWAANLTFTMLAMAAPPAQGPSQNGTKTTNETGNEAENRPETAVPYGLIIAGVAAATAIAVLIKLPWLLKRLR